MATYRSAHAHAANRERGIADGCARVVSQGTERIDGCALAPSMTIRCVLGSLGRERPCNASSPRAFEPDLICGCGCGSLNVGAFEGCSAPKLLGCSPDDAGLVHKCACARHGRAVPRHRNARFISFAPIRQLARSSAGTARLIRTFSAESVLN